jgi:hypothetical protein
MSFSCPGRRLEINDKKAAAKPYEGIFPVGVACSLPDVSVGNFTRYTGLSTCESEGSSKR